MSSQAERRAATIASILASARSLFGARGFEATSIDDIAEGAGVAKGAVYHHFDSKEAVFTAVLQGVQADILAAISTAESTAETRHKSDLADVVAEGVGRYLRAASAPGIRQILLIDGPAVLGWKRWRDIDNQYFGATARTAIAALLGHGACAAEVDAHSHLFMGAVMEAAIVCATGNDVDRRAGELADALRKMLKGLAAKS